MRSDKRRILKRRLMLGIALAILLLSITPSLLSAYGLLVGANAAGYKEVGSAGNTGDKTLGGVPSVDTVSVDLLVTGANVNGVILNEGSFPVQSYGIAYSRTNPSPIVSDGVISQSGTGLIGGFSNRLMDGVSGGLVYVRAYATNSLGTGYGRSLLISTPAAETVGLFPLVFLVLGMITILRFLFRDTENMSGMTKLLLIFLLLVLLGIFVGVINTTIGNV